MITLLLLVHVTYVWVLFFAHIPFIVNNATPTERLQQYSSALWKAVRIKFSTLVLFLTRIYTEAILITWFWLCEKPSDGTGFRKRTNTRCANEGCLLSVFSGKFPDKFDPSGFVQMCSVRWRSSTTLLVGLIPTRFESNCVQIKIKGNLRNLCSILHFSFDCAMQLLASCKRLAIGKLKADNRFHSSLLYPWNSILGI